MAPYLNLTVAEFTPEIPFFDVMEQMSCQEWASNSCLITASNDIKLILTILCIIPLISIAILSLAPKQWMLDNLWVIKVLCGVSLFIAGANLLYYNSVHSI